MRPIRLWRRPFSSWLPWLWLVWGIVLLVLLWMTSDTGGSPQDKLSSGRRSASGDDRMSIAPAMLSEFGAFVVERGAIRHSERTTEFTAEGLRKLAAALTHVATGRTADTPRLRQQIDRVRAKAVLLGAEPPRAGEPRLATDAIAIAVEVMATIQRLRYPHLDRAMAEVREAALRIRPDQPLPGQADAVQRFFERSHDVLRAMAG